MKGSAAPPGSGIAVRPGNGPGVSKAEEATEEGACDGDWGGTAIGGWGAGKTSDSSISESVANGSASRLALAVICSVEAALAHGLEVLARDIADDPGNATRFVLLGPRAEQPPPGVPTKTSLAVLVDHRQGALMGFLGDLAAASLNLTRIESRPQPRTPWQYLEPSPPLSSRGGWRL